ncbi:hypothetical protein JKP88DRAFT_304350, partial [Tribonema minus]
QPACARVPDGEVEWHQLTGCLPLSARIRHQHYRSSSRGSRWLIFNQQKRARTDMVRVRGPAQGWFLSTSASDTVLQQDGASNEAPEHLVDTKDPLRTFQLNGDGGWRMRQLPTSQSDLASSSSILLCIAMQHGVKLPASRDAALQAVTTELGSLDGVVDARQPLLALCKRFGVAPLQQRVPSVSVIPLASVGSSKTTTNTKIDKKRTVQELSSEQNTTSEDSESMEDTDDEEFVDKNYQHKHRQLRKQRFEGDAANSRGASRKAMRSPPRKLPRRSCKA